MKKVSIIIPCYNQGSYIDEAIESALNQTYKNTEIICINDGSTDNSSEIIKTYAHKYSNIIFLDEKENRGVIQARNAAINASNGEYILPLDADDKIDKTYVEKAVEVLDKNPDIGIVYCKAKLFGKKEKEWQLADFSKDKMLYTNQIFCTAMFRKSEFQKADGYKEYMSEGCEDWDLWLSFIEMGLSAYKIDETLFFYRQQHQKTRTDCAKNKLEEIHFQLLKHHLPLYLENKDFTKKIFAVPKDHKIKNYKLVLKIVSVFCLIEIFAIGWLLTKVI